MSRLAPQQADIFIELGRRVDASAEHFTFLRRQVKPSIPSFSFLLVDKLARKAGTERKT